MREHAQLVTSFMWPSSVDATASMCEMAWSSAGSEDELDHRNNLIIPPRSICADSTLPAYAMSAVGETFCTRNAISSIMVLNRSFSGHTSAARSPSDAAVTSWRMLFNVN